MRKFNPRERNFLKLLNNISNQDMELFPYFLQHQYFTEDKKTALFLLNKQKEAFLFIKKDVFDNMKSRKIELINFIEILSLIGYLKQNRLVDLFHVAENSSTTMSVMYSGFGNIRQEKPDSNLIVSENGFHLKFPDFSKIYDVNNKIKFEAVKLEKHTYEMIQDNLSGLLFVSEELKEFVNNGFKSKEDLRYRIGQVTTWIGIGLAIIFGLFGIYNPFEKEESHSYEFDKIQYNEIIKKNNQIHDHIHEIIESSELENKYDSLNN